MGIKREQKALSYNVQQVKAEELTKVKDANFVNNLNGKVAGVNIQRSASGVGGATKVIMRGAKSITGNNNALYVVDGIPLNNASSAPMVAISVLLEVVKVSQTSTPKISRVSIS